MVDMSVQIGSLVLKNPVLTASGTFGYGTEYDSYMKVEKLGGIITKTITPDRRRGNPLPRLAETPAGMLNSIGLANVGCKTFIREKLPALEDLHTNVIVNIAGRTLDDYIYMAEALSGQERVDALEINISCPNVKQGGLAFGTDPGVTEKVVASVRKMTDKPIITKLTPNVTDIVCIARAAVEGGTDAVSLINTVLGMGIDIGTRKSLLASGAGGLSGPAIKPIAVAKVYQVAQNVSVPVVGLGGIMKWQDIIEFILAGASAVQIGTLTFVHPDKTGDMPSDLERYCMHNGIEKLTDLRGKMEKV